MGTHFVVDTNVVIDFLNGRLPADGAAWVQLATERRFLLLPVVVRIELLSWRGSPSEMNLLEEFMATTAPLILDEPVIQATIALRQQHKVKLPDALIAASTIVANVPLLTRNTSDFKHFLGLSVLNPHIPTQLPMLV